MASTEQPAPPDYPIPIFRLGHRYYLYHAPTIAHLRSHHNIPGILSGTLPQSPQQNVFLGLPLTLIPEEARLLVTKGLGYIVDDAAAHRQGIHDLNSPDGRQRRQDWQMRLADVGRGIAKSLEDKKGDERARALANIPANAASKRLERRGQVPSTNDGEQAAHDHADILFHGSADAAATLPTPAPTPSPAPEPGLSVAPYTLTPTTSYPPLLTPQIPSTTSPADVPVPPSYPLYAHLHERGYFLSPGLRFGCQYLAYPGDPLRYHSHFLAVGRGWDEEVELLTLVGGGRLGTGVKKGFLIGGVEDTDGGDGAGNEDLGEGVRCFAIEWGGM